MPEPFKNLLNQAVIHAMAGHLSRVAPDFHASGFDSDGFIAYATDGLEGRELKQRSTRITDALERFLPEDFATATGILVASLAPDTGFSVGDLGAGELGGGDLNAGAAATGILGWPVMPMADYVARRGLDHLAQSLDVLQTMTTRSSSEFAIRPFLHHHPEATLATLATWIPHENEHVRRLVSEGTRPRLPWGMRLTRFVDDPGPVIELLHRLRDDPSEYVRRSVANNLNDIAKDHADRVAHIAEEWLPKKASPERQRLVRHALRTLIKAGHPGALAALGYGPPQVDAVQFDLHTPTVVLGETVKFDLMLTSTARADQPLILDYAVHHMRANGKTTAKVFKWKTVTLKPGETFRGTRRHPIRPVTTRRYYPGAHRVEILVNGQSLGGADFVLHMD